MGDCGELVVGGNLRMLKEGKREGKGGGTLKNNDQNDARASRMVS